MHRIWWAGLGLAALLVAASGCSSSDDTSSATSTCESLQGFATELRGLTDVDLVSGGTDALDEQLSSIESSWDEVRDSGSDQFGEQVDALDAALDDLGDTITNAVEDGGSIDVVIGELRDDLDAVTAAWNDLRDVAETELSGCELSAVS